MRFSYRLDITFLAAADIGSTGYVQGGIMYFCDSRERAEALLLTEVAAMTPIERANYKATITRSTA